MLRSTAALEDYNGNSREPASRFKIHYRNASKGCPYKVARSQQVEKNKLICPGAPQISVRVSDKVSDKVSKPRPYTPSACAGGHTDGDTTYFFPTMKDFELNSPKQLLHRNLCRVRPGSLHLSWMFAQKGLYGLLLRPRPPCTGSQACWEQKCAVAISYVQIHQKAMSLPFG